MPEPIVWRSPWPYVVFPIQTGSSAKTIYRKGRGVHAERSPVRASTAPKDSDQ